MLLLDRSTMNNYQIVFLLIALSGCFIAEGVKQIQVIQRNNGVLRLPPEVAVPTDIPDLWFDQVLDHFNPSNPVLWKQVGNHSYFLLYHTG